MRQVKHEEKPSRRKSAKGMTLIECIISILVVGVSGLIMVTAATTVSHLLMETTHINNKVDAEAPIVNIKDVDALRDGGGNFIAAVDNNGNPIAVEQDVTIIVGQTNAAGTAMDSSKTYKTVNAKKYNTASSAAGANADTHMNSNLEFYEIQP
ncbi:MAG: prepilin-type N-terminal cleavage/methylation domain-containing protein [Oscillospiraceae bacterium]|nr:prepilin-type N-terminal cleavage/methylation domain-containing protein [Oscillospiraceae bacterium]